MEAKECNLQSIFSENKNYFIPAYQRPYSWDAENARQLVDDLYQNYLSDGKEYFIGSMICTNRKEEGKGFEVVDGQQRLTTISIIISELKGVVKKQTVKDDLQKRILPIDAYSDKTEQPRLLVRAKERDLYNYYILQGQKEYLPQKLTDTESLFVDNAKTIRDYFNEISNCDKEKEDLLRGFAKYLLQNVFVVFVQTNDFASSFRLFNVLNNRGLSLSNSDLLKSALFESASAAGTASDVAQIESLWAKLEDTVVGIKNIDAVGVKSIDNFMTLHQMSEKNSLNRVFKRGFDYFFDVLGKEEYSNDAVKMLKKLVGSANNYEKIIENDVFDVASQKRINSLKCLVADEWIPPVLAFLNKSNTECAVINEDQFSIFLSVFEKVYMHGWFKKEMKNKRLAVCYSAISAINNNKKLSEIIEIISGCTSNDKFFDSLDDCLYESRPNQISFIKAVLLRIDSEQQDESVKKTYKGSITIEHILPQKMEDEYWINRFTAQDHGLWGHRFGNLTLISRSKNSEAKNSNFEKKKQIYVGSSFDITKNLCQLSDWGVKELSNRHEAFKNKIKELWTV